MAIPFLWLFCFSARAQAPTQIPAQWSNAVRTLADKIAADAGSPSALAMNLTDASSLSAADASAVYDGVLAVLRARRFSIVSPEPPGGRDTRVQVTLSENAETYIWTAEIWLAAGPDKSTERQVAIVSTPRGANAAGNESLVAVTLNRKVIWTQAAKILDFAPLNEPQTTELAILEGERVVVYRADGGNWRLDRAVPLFHSGVWRDMTGLIDPNTGNVSFFGAKCEGDVRHLEQLRCQAGGNATVPAPVITTPYGAPRADTIAIGPACASVGPMLLGAGTGDWTQADDLRAYEQNSQVHAIGQLDFTGPILVLRATADGKSARVVSRNLQTGMYEASIVSISCGN
jgi:hypothetical protein